MSKATKKWSYFAALTSFFFFYLILSVFVCIFLHVHLFSSISIIYNKILTSDPALLTRGANTCFYINSAKNLTLTWPLFISCTSCCRWYKQYFGYRSIVTLQYYEHGVNDCFTHFKDFTVSLTAWKSTKVSLYPNLDGWRLDALLKDTSTCDCVVMYCFVLKCVSYI